MPLLMMVCPPLAGGGEATPCDTPRELARIEVAYRVREDSAVPLVLPGQVILGGAERAPGDLDAWEGRLAAVTLDDGTSIFKRVGARLSGGLANLRLFETIGGLGSSLVIATEAVDGGAGTPVRRPQASQAVASLEKGPPSPANAAAGGWRQAGGACRDA